MVQNKGEEWRVAMPVVHAAVDALLYHGTVQLSWTGKARETCSGSYRIASRWAAKSKQRAKLPRPTAPNKPDEESLYRLR